jgi:hypothetical protein
MDKAEIMKQVIEILQGIWAVVNGRWFIWSNASDKTVELIAQLKFDETELQEMVRQAQEELRARGQG